MSSTSQTPTFDPYKDYVLGRTSEEYQRLRRQARVWEEATSRVLQQAGLREGMHCLDIGCGPGEVMRLIGETVGQTGQVTGLDVDGKLGRESLEVLRASKVSNFAFIEADVESIDVLDANGGQPFDLTYGRLILYHANNPVGLLRKMYEWTKPGGTVVVQDYDCRSVGLTPEIEAWPEFEKVLFGVMERVGRDARTGRKLAHFFHESAIGNPDGTDLVGIYRPLAELNEIIQVTYRSVLPHALKMGLTTEARSRWFIEELDKAAADGRYYAFMPLLISAWKRKPV